MVEVVLIVSCSSRQLPPATKLGRYCFHLCLSVCLSVCVSVCLSVCEQPLDHSFSCRVMKLLGINCYVKIWKCLIFKGQGQDRPVGVTIINCSYDKCYRPTPGKWP